MRCENLICQHPVIFWTGMLIVAVLLAMLQIGKALSRKDPGNGGGGDDRPPGGDIPDPRNGELVDVDDHPTVTAFNLHDRVDVHIPAPKPGRVIAPEIPAHTYYPQREVGQEQPIEWGAWVERENAKRE